MTFPPARARTGAFLLAVLALLPLGAGPAFAHAHLRASEPAADHAVPAARTVRLTFSEAVEPRFCTVTLSTAAGAPVEAPRAVADPADPKVLVLALPAPLPPGEYRVSWRATAVDTHRTEGEFAFTVRP